MMNSSTIFDPDADPVESGKTWRYGMDFRQLERCIFNKLSGKRSRSLPQKDPPSEAKEEAPADAGGGWAKATASDEGVSLGGGGGGGGGGGCVPQSRLYAELAQRLLMCPGVANRVQLLTPPDVSENPNSPRQASNSTQPGAVTHGKATPQVASNRCSSPPEEVQPPPRRHHRRRQRRKASLARALASIIRLAANPESHSDSRPRERERCRSSRERDSRSQKPPESCDRGVEGGESGGEDEEKEKDEENENGESGDGLQVEVTGTNHPEGGLLLTFHKSCTKHASRKDLLAPKKSLRFMLERGGTLCVDMDTLESTSRTEESNSKKLDTIIQNDTSQQSTKDVVVSCTEESSSVEILSICASNTGSDSKSIFTQDSQQSLPEEGVRNEENKDTLFEELQEKEETVERKEHELYDWSSVIEQDASEATLAGDQENLRSSEEMEGMRITEEDVGMGEEESEVMLIPEKGSSIDNPNTEGAEIIEKDSGIDEPSFKNEKKSGVALPEGVSEEKAKVQVVKEKTAKEKEEIAEMNKVGTPAQQNKPEMQKDNVSLQNLARPPRFAILSDHEGKPSGHLEISQWNLSPNGELVITCHAVHGLKIEEPTLEKKDTVTCSLPKMPTSKRVAFTPSQSSRNQPCPTCPLGGPCPMYQGGINPLNAPYPPYPADGKWPAWPMGAVYPPQPYPMVGTKYPSCSLDDKYPACSVKGTCPTCPLGGSCPMYKGGSVCKGGSCSVCKGGSCSVCKGGSCPMYKDGTCPMCEGGFCPMCKGGSCSMCKDGLCQMGGSCPYNRMYRQSKLKPTPQSSKAQSHPRKPAVTNVKKSQSPAPPRGGQTGNLKRPVIQAARTNKPPAAPINPRQKRPSDAGSLSSATQGSQDSHSGGVNPQAPNILNSPGTGVVSPSDASTKRIVKTIDGTMRGQRLAAGAEGPSNISCPFHNVVEVSRQLNPTFDEQRSCIPVVVKISSSSRKYMHSTWSNLFTDVTELNLDDQPSEKEIKSHYIESVPSQILTNVMGDVYEHSQEPTTVINECISRPEEDGRWFNQETVTVMRYSQPARQMFPPQNIQSNADNFLRISEVKRQHVHFCPDIDINIIPDSSPEVLNRKESNQDSTMENEDINLKITLNGLQNPYSRKVSKGSDSPTIRLQKQKQSSGPSTISSYQSPMQHIKRRKSTFPANKQKPFPPPPLKIKPSSKSSSKGRKTSSPIAKRPVSPSQNAKRPKSSSQSKKRLKSPAPSLKRSKSSIPVPKHRNTPSPSSTRRNSPGKKQEEEGKLSGKKQEEEGKLPSKKQEEVEKSPSKKLCQKTLSPSVKTKKSSSPTVKRKNSISPILKRKRSASPMESTGDRKSSPSLPKKSQKPSGEKYRHPEKLSKPVSRRKKLTHKTASGRITKSRLATMRKDKISANTQEKCCQETEISPPTGTKTAIPAKFRKWKKCTPDDKKKTQIEPQPAPESKKKHDAKSFKELLIEQLEATIPHGKKQEHQALIEQHFLPNELDGSMIRSRIKPVVLEQSSVDVMPKAPTSSPNSSSLSSLSMSGSLTTDVEEQVEHTNATNESKEEEEEQKKNKVVVPEDTDVSQKENKTSDSSYSSDSEESFSEQNQRSPQLGKRKKRAKLADDAAAKVACSSYSLRKRRPFFQWVQHAVKSKFLRLKAKTRNIFTTEDSGTESATDTQEN